MMMLIVPQLEILIGCGATKSLTSDGNDAAERLLKALPNARQVPAGKTPAAVRLITASPKVLAGRLTLAMGSVTVTALTAPSAKPASLRSMRLSLTPSRASCVRAPTRQVVGREAVRRGAVGCGQPDEQAEVGCRCRRSRR